MNLNVIDLIQTLFPIMTFIYIRFLLTPRKNFKYLFPVFIILGIVFISYFIPRWFPYSPLKTILNALIFLIYSFVCFKDRIYYVIYANILYLLFFAFGDTLTLLIANMIGLNPMDESVTAIFLLLDILLIGSLYIVAYYIFQKVTKKTTKRHLIFFLIFPLSQLLFFMLPFYTPASVILLHGTQNWDLLIMYTVCFIFFILSDVMLLIVLNDNSKNKKLEDQLSLMEYQTELQLKHYQKIQANEQDIRKMKHDINNALQIARALLNSKSESSKSDANKLLEEIEDNLNKTKPVIYCENEIVNFIISDKVSVINDLKIDFQINAEIPACLIIPSLDLCRVFTNIIDNAIEASQSNIHREKSYIILKSAIINDYLYVTTENYFDGDLKYINDSYQTTKSNTKLHGLGLKILSEIANNYNGNLSTSYKENIFTTVISLCILPIEKPKFSSSE